MKQVLIFLLLMVSVVAVADDYPITSSTVSALQWRLVGPAMTSGRIGDFAVNPDNPAEYYAAASSGGVWKTTNSGVTWKSVFDGEASYSIGCLTMDPKDSQVVWVGTGENNSQRSVSFGDGIYKSVNGGKSWKNMGLKESEHIGMILVDPRDSDVVFVAAQGPLWNAGGDRGLYKTVDGGTTWECILHISDDTGINEVHMEPGNPDVMYASAYQRRRHVWTLINGGPESGIYKSVDGGKTWNELKSGLPGSDMGRIGMDVAPTDPARVYAIVEAAEGSGFYRSDNRGVSWRKVSDYVSTSPQYYQEIEVDPKNADRIWSLNTYLSYSDDGGANWDRANLSAKHVDDHAIWIDPDFTDHMRIGCDGGIYETWDAGKKWDFKSNIPCTQFYKVHVDNDAPFYSVYGGTQDNNSLGTYTRNTTAHGIRNSDWFITVGGDGYETQVDPTNSNIVYSQWQYGGLIRYDKLNGETIDIQPQPAWGDPQYRFNWNTPLLISPHNHKRLFYGGQVLLQSDDRGNSWREISGDLSRNLDRNKLDVMGRVWSVDAVAKNKSTSMYGSLITVDESILREGLIFTGTDDGLVQVTKDGGQNWTKYDKFPGVPDMSYVGDIMADRFAENTVYVCLENHKKGDFKPYLLRSDDYGKSWKSIAGDLPERGMVHCIEQDTENQNLLFAGTEFGAFFSLNGGENWVELSSGLPTIAVRDIDVQRRENDLAVGTFGRGIYILDDYSMLRDLSEEMLEEQAKIFPIKDALMYHTRTPLGGGGRGNQGDSFFIADNPTYGAVFTYHIKDKVETRKEIRQSAEAELKEEGEDNPYPSWDELKLEDREDSPMLYLEISDSSGEVVRRINASNSSGIHRTSWDMRYASLRAAGNEPSTGSGPMVAPGKYSVQLFLYNNGEISSLGNSAEFNCVPLGVATLPAEDRAELVAFQQKCVKLQRALNATSRVCSDAQDRVQKLQASLFSMPDVDQGLVTEIQSLETRLTDIKEALSGDPTRPKRSESAPPSLSSRLGRAIWGSWESTSAPTGTHRQTYDLVAEKFPPILEQVRELVGTELTDIENKLEEAGAPWTPGRLPVWKEN
ncbi:MAG: glycosyl hydrolase [bacterium]|nr:glycosyl hydrolase [bacterium]